jgi:hypothetical protein
MSRHRRRAVLGLVLLLAAVMVALGVHVSGSGSAGGSTTGQSAQSSSAGARVEARLTALERREAHRHQAAYFERVRNAVLAGVRRDFREGTGIGGRPFRSCLEGLLRERLDPPVITGLVAIHRTPGGNAYAAQALNGLAAPLAADCGHRSWAPELVGAARGLSFGHPTGAAVRKLGITYGPYLGRRCRPPGRRNCERVGIDVAFRHAATRVVAVAGPQKIHLRTPGKHDGVRYRDWVGTFTHAGFPRPARGAGGTIVYATVELRVRFADGRRLAALLPHVPLLPGWG